MKKKLIVGSKNPVKINAVQLAFEAVFSAQEFEVEGISVPSGVAEQPMSDSETLQGARNRATAAKQAVEDAHFWVGIEGGVAPCEVDELESFAWVFIIGPEGKAGKARTSSFFLPPPVVKLINEGMELGHANDKIFSKVNSKQHNGASGLLSNDAVTRTMLYYQPVALALAPFVLPELYA